MRNTHTYVLAAILCIIGISVFFYKWQVTGLPIHPGEKAPAWEIEHKLTFEAAGQPAKLTLHLPSDTTNKAIIKERVVAPQFGISRKNVGNRQVTLTKRAADGRQLVFLRTYVHSFKTHAKSEKLSTPEVSKPTLNEAQTSVAQHVLSEAEAKSVDETTLVTVLLKKLKSSENNGNIIEFTAGASKGTALADAAVKILALKSIPARRVNGISLKGDKKHAKFVHWLEVFIEGVWKPFSLENGEQEISSDLLPWWYGSTSFAKLEGGTKLKVEILIEQQEQRVLDRILSTLKTERDELISFSLFGLPLATQDVYRILMVVPLGVFLLVLLRNVVGVANLGTFMPVLIALAFRETHLVWGLILFVGVVGSGLIFRFYLEHLRLLLVPRLASVLIFVLLLMACLSVLTNALGFERGLSVALFPMVIMTMTVERVSVIWDERGPGKALTEAGGSLLIAVLCYLLMTRQIVEHLFFTFPELVLILLAATLLLGRYTGYRLLELRRFKVLAQEGA